MPRILVIEAMLPGTAGGEVLGVRWSQLDAACLERIRPALVVCPLLTPDFDAIEAIERLGRLGWQGRLHVLLPALPNPGLVRRELQSFARDTAPAITVEVLETLAAL